jgi:hypothetical protein
MSASPQLLTAVVAPRSAIASGPRALSTRLLTLSAQAWFVVALVGQCLMAVYVLGFYGRAALEGDFERWNRVLFNGHVAGDSIGNATLGSHLALSVLIVLGGALQLIPAVRRRWPRLHRWTGRVYLLSAGVLAVGGLYLVWSRPSLSGRLSDLGISFNALLILGFGALTVWHAMRRQFEAHRRWALRLFLAVSGVWFFRVCLMFWLLLNQGPVGFDADTFRGPFLSFLYFAQTLLPLALLELYLRAQRSPHARQHYAAAGALAAATLVTAVGVFGAAMMMWLPRL